MGFDSKKLGEKDGLLSHTTPRDDNPDGEIDRVTELPLAMLDALFDEEPEEPRPGLENLRPISDLVEVVQGLEALAKKHQEGPQDEEDILDLEDLLDELDFIAGDFYGRRMDPPVAMLFTRVEKSRQALCSRPAWAVELKELPGEKELALLRANNYYAVGLPHQIDKLEQPYNRTLDIVMLVTELMQREGKPTCLLVANLATETRTKEEARLIGLKDLIFYEALQDMLLEMSLPDGRPLQRLPVILMTDVDHLPEFSERRSAVGELFSENAAFRDAVYACVPNRLRHRKHHGKTYAELETMENPAALEVARSRVPYVLDQISRVSSIGAKKWGHEKEKKYDEATALAEELLGVGENKTRTTFGYVSLANSKGTIPYRAAAGLKDPMDIPGILTSYGRLENQMDALRVFAEQRRVPIDGTNLLLQEAEEAADRARAELPPDPDKVARADAWRAKLLEAIQIIVSSYALSILEEFESSSIPLRALDKFLMGLSEKFIKQLLKHPKVSLEERELVEDAYMMQTRRETYLAKAGGVIPKDYVLMSRMDIFSVLAEEAPPEAIAKQSGKWIPFVVSPPAKGSTYDYVPIVISSLLFGSGAPYEHNANEVDRRFSTQAIGHWVIPYPAFEALLFSEKKHLGPPQTSAEVKEALDSLVETPEKVRWRTFDEFITAIEGTPVEIFYQAWIASLTGVTDPTPRPLPPEFAQSQQAEKIRQILLRPCFSESFRNNFLLILSGQ